MTRLFASGLLLRVGPQGLLTLGTRGDKEASTGMLSLEPWRGCTPRPNQTEHEVFRPPSLIVSSLLVPGGRSPCICNEPSAMSSACARKRCEGMVWTSIPGKQEVQKSLVVNLWARMGCEGHHRGRRKVPVRWRLTCKRAGIGITVPSVLVRDCIEEGPVGNLAHGRRCDHRARSTDEPLGRPPDDPEVSVHLT